MKQIENWVCRVTDNKSRMVYHRLLPYKAVDCELLVVYNFFLKNGLNRFHLAVPFIFQRFADLNYRMTTVKHSLRVVFTFDRPALHEPYIKTEFYAKMHRNSNVVGLGN